MSTGMPELGSKISLISKADIRYEGELYTVDPVECTIALSNVRSFGTEEREAQCPVPAQNQIYDFILFRGSDIKDIRVVQSQPMPPNDPAIVQHQISHPPPSAAPGYPVVQPGGPHAYSHMGGAPAPGSHLMGNTHSMGHVHPSAIGGGYNPMSGSVLDLIGSLSRSSTPAPRKSPSIGDLGAPGTRGSGSGLNMGSRAVQRPPSRQSRSRERLNNMQHSSSSTQPALTYRDRNDFYDRNLDRAGGNDHVGQRHDYHRGGDRNDHYRGGYRDGGDRDHYQRGGDHRSRGDHRGEYRDNYRMSGSGQRGGGGWHNQQRSNSGGRRTGGNPRPRSRGPGFRGGKTNNTLKFESDYDFDKANSEFNEMLSKLNDTKLDDGGAPVVVNGTANHNGVSGDGPDGKKQDDSGNETGVGEGGDDEAFYDKTKSFFDNISCEAVERSKGAFQRTDWRQERKMNSETFGVAATRRGGGGYRGRGGFYYGGGGRGYNHRNHYNNQGRNNRGGYGGPRLSGNRGNYQNQERTPKETTNSSSTNGVNTSTSGVKTAAQVVASNPAPVPVPTEAK